jgi:hypothetical protein
VPVAAQIPPPTPPKALDKPTRRPKAAEKAAPQAAQGKAPTATPNAERPRAGATSSIAPRSEDKSMEPGSNVAQKASAARRVVRIAAGGRPAKKPEPLPGTGPRGRPTGPQPTGDDRRHFVPSGGPKIEINPRLQSSKGIISTPAPEAQGKKPMSVAAKHRAQAEAMFAKITGSEAPPPMPPAPTPAPAAAPPAPMPSTPAPPPSAAAYGQNNRDTFGGLRINERDSLTTALRLAPSREAAFDAAKQLADRYQLPPDQNLLVKVIELADARLTQLALEELLELDDRGRVRPNPELKNAISGVKAADSETEELKQLFLQKIRAG